MSQKQNRLSISAIPALLGVWGRDAAVRQWQEVRGLVEPRPETFAMRLGAELTDDILTLAGIPAGAVREMPCKLVLARGVLTGRCDALDADGRVWEAKSVVRLSDRMHLAAELQAQLYAAALHARAVRLVFLELLSRTLYVRDIEPDAGMVRSALEAVERLFERWDEDAAVLDVQLYAPVERHAPPNYVDELAAAQVLAEELHAIREQRRILDEREAALRKALLELLPADGAYDAGDYRITITSHVTTTLDTAAIPPDIAQQYGRQSVRRVLSVKKRGET